MGIRSGPGAEFLEHWEIVRCTSFREVRVIKGGGEIDWGSFFRRSLEEKFEVIGFCIFLRVFGRGGREVRGIGKCVCERDLLTFQDKGPNGGH